MAGNGVAVVEMTVLVGAEVDLAGVAEAGGEATIGLDRLDDLPCRDSQRRAICRET